MSVRKIEGSLNLSINRIFDSLNRDKNLQTRPGPIKFIVQDETMLKMFLKNEYVQSHTEPVLFELRLNHIFDYMGYAFVGKPLWFYQDAVYQVTGGFTNEEKKLLILDYVDKERQKFERLKAKFSGEQSESINYERTRIPESVRIEVWRRDQGKCARCGSREKLEYDHIVPVTRGGSNTARNVELLCEVCNRSQRDRIQ